MYLSVHKSKACTHISRTVLYSRSIWLLASHDVPRLDVSVDKVVFYEGAAAPFANGMGSTTNKQSVY